MVIVLKHIESYRLYKAEIIKAKPKDLPLKKDGWNFNWKGATKKTNSTIYVLKILDNKYPEVQGAVQLINMDGMLIMDLIEVHPLNIGRNNGFMHVGGCLIAFACREALKLKSDYYGYLTFESKTQLIDLYVEKYGAVQTIGSRMYIPPENGKKLIEKYLKK